MQQHVREVLAILSPVLMFVVVVAVGGFAHSRRPQSQTEPAVLDQDSTEAVRKSLWLGLANQVDTLAVRADMAIVEVSQAVSRLTFEHGFVAFASYGDTRYELEFAAVLFRQMADVFRAAHAAGIKDDEVSSWTLHLIEVDPRKYDAFQLQDFNDQIKDLMFDVLATKLDLA